jgi:hypothetical protein
MPDEFKLPLGLRNRDPLFRPEKIAQLEGYELSLLEDCENAYRFTAVVSVEKVVPIIRDFARYLTDEAFFILEYYPEETLMQLPADDENQPAPEVYYSPYSPTGEILGLIKPYLERLVHDGFVGFGLANNRLGLEMFYSEEKVLTFFTDNHLRLCHFFRKHNLPFQAELVLPTDFSHDHLALVGFARHELPAELAKLSPIDLDAVNFCQQLVDLLDMYPVEEGISFFLTRKEQEELTRMLGSQEVFDAEEEVEFGSLLLNWSDFVTECEEGFDGDLDEYRLGLKIRDLIQFVIDAANPDLAAKIEKIVEEPDAGFRRILVDRRKRIDSGDAQDVAQQPFWYQGVVRHQGVVLRRDLIRNGWFAS